MAKLVVILLLSMNNLITILQAKMSQQRRRLMTQLSLIRNDKTIMVAVIGFEIQILSSSSLNQDYCRTSLPCLAVSQQYSAR